MRKQALWSRHVATLTNCTFFGNIIGPETDGGTTMKVNNCTITGNQFGFTNYGTAIFNNTVMVYNSTPLTGSALNATSSHNITEGTPAEAGLEVDENGYAVLKDNGGPTPTIALTTRGSAVNAGNNDLIPAGVTTDQRGTGYNRTKGGTVDIGAYESSIAPLSLPTITSFSPTKGSAGTTVVITGTHFTGATSVTFNGTAATIFTVNSDTQITATAPTGVTTGKIAVTTGSGIATSTDDFIVNSPPTANNDTVTVNQNSGATALDVLANDSTSPDTGETLSITSATQPSHGTVTFTASAVSYTPSAGYVGSDSFIYTINDGFGGTATATVTVTVVKLNQAPSITTTTLPSGTVGTTYTTTLAASDADGDTLTWSLTAGSLPLGLYLDGSGLISGIPAFGASGTFNFTLQVSDGQLTDSRAFSLTVIRAQSSSGHHHDQPAWGQRWLGILAAN